MVQPPNPVLLYNPDGYQVARKDLKGRHSAGEAFLTSFLAQTPAPDVYALCLGPQGVTDFQATIKSCGRPLTPRAVARTDLEALRRQGLVYLPFPGLAQEARLRSFFGDDSYAISGVTHTISSKNVLDGIADLAVAPLRPWDALICTSKAVHAALSTVLSNTEEDLRSRLGAQRFTRPLMPVIPLGVHADRFVRKDADRARWRKQFGLADDTTAILFFGRLSVHAKAAPFQLAQAAELAARQSGQPMAIIWCGWFNDEFQRKVFMNTAKSMAPSVPFHHVDGREAAARFSIWAAADVFCSLADNIQESFGLTVIEAMAAGLPTIVSNWNGYREAVEHGKNGVLIDTYLPDSGLTEAAYRHVAEVDTYDLYIGALSQFCFVDVVQTAEWLARLAGDPGLQRGLGEAGQRTVAAAFDWKVVMPRYFDLWAEQAALLAAGRGQSPSSTTWKSLDPTETFAGFPSHRLGAETRLSRGPHFGRWNDLVQQPGIVINAGVLIGRPAFQALQKAFAATEQATTVADLLAPFGPAERPAVNRALYWLVKVGLARLARD